MLKLIYGKSGSGKSLSLYNDIKENLSHEKIFLIVPEQSNLSAEQKLFNTLGVNSILNVEVLTLSRMASRILNELGLENRVHLSQSRKAMIISDILKKESKDLKFLGKSDKNIDISINMITEFKKHNVTTEMLENAEIGDTYTKIKLQDINLIYKKYEEKIKSSFIDENDILTIVTNKIKESTLFENSLVYIDDFSGFTSQEYKIFEELIKKCDRVTIAISTDSLEKVDKERDIFYFNKVFAEKIIEIAKRNGSKIETCKCDVNYRLQNDELKFLEEAMSVNTSFKPYDKKTDNIKMFLANNSYTELEFVANEILNLVKNENYKYNEIAIISDNLDEYSIEATIIFNKYNIPIFIDEKKELNQNILIKYILAILEIFSQNWSFDSVFNFLKLGMTDISYEDIYILENYCIKWGIRNYKWFKEFNYEEVNEIQEKVEKIRVKLTTMLTEFKEKVSKNRTAEEITKCIYEFLIQNNIPEILDNKLKAINDLEVNNEYNTSYKILVKILDEIVAIFGKEKISFEDYKDLLQVGFSESELGKIPMAQDVVILGDSRRSRNSNIKVCFIVGINDGFFPTSNKFEGYLNDRDRGFLKETGIELAKTSLELLYESNFEIYNILSLASQKLYLSYASSDKEGKSIRPSMLIKKIKRIFPNISEASDIISKDYFVTNEIATFDDAISVYKKFLDGESISDEWKEVLNYYRLNESEKFERVLRGLEYSNKSQDISEKNVEKMYGKRLKTSISRLEKYRECPFSFHLQYGLNLREKPELKVQSLNTGTFMHEVVDQFFETLADEELNLKSLSDEEIKNIVEKIIDECLEMAKYYAFSSTAKYQILTKRLKKVVLESINYIVYTLKSSKFDVLGNEVEFSNSSKYKPILINLDDGRTVEITGKIDRIDVGVLGDKKYVRIIDYKSSVRDVDLKKVEAGLQIQLITYLDAVSKQDDFEPSGVLYLGLVDNIYKANKNVSDEDIKKEIRKMFKMKGLILADIDVVKMMDTNLTSGASDIIPANIKVDGDLGENKSLVNEEKFKELQENVKEVIKEISKEILAGKIDIKPYKYQRNTGCDYCKYKSVCMFNLNVKGNAYNYI